ncbi:MAG: DNA-binding protein WhiA [Lachnospiraceae bacterium]|nr:DNA-binding protein WhiA [Lachnospiraceae bacterium]MBR4342569.1 DNA-binding protein WhiA [Lachnospiraceae bacterium]
MNFTEKVKQELCRSIPNPRHCRLAELGGIIASLGKIDRETGELVIFSENELVIKITEKLLNKIFSVDNIGRKFYDIKRSGKETGRIVFDGQEKEEVLKAVKIDGDSLLADPVLYIMTCCKRAYLRGAFIGAGSLTDPNKDYHFEISVLEEGCARNLQSLAQELGVEAKLIKRKKQFVVYVKDSEMISEILNIMGAPVAMMELENVKIYKGLKNHVNRQVNCDSANIKKTLDASRRQQDDIRLIRECTGFKGLADELVEIALLRERYPEATLSELVVYNGGTVGKSGINHRLKKLSDIADKLRSEMPLKAGE